MMLLKRYLRSELSTLLRNNIRFKVIGRTDALAPDVLSELLDAERKTAANTGMLFNIALNYGGRTEIVDAARRAIGRRARAAGPRRGRFASFLYTAGQPDPDLLIRTSGEMRVSNFLLWQIAYAEIWVTDTLWPDFRCRHLLEGVLAYQKRDRRYGGIAAPVAGWSEVSGEFRPIKPSDLSPNPSMTRLLSGVGARGRVRRPGLVSLVRRPCSRWRLASPRSPSRNTRASSRPLARTCRGGRPGPPRWSPCAMVPFPWLPVESVLAGALLLIALNVLASERTGHAAPGRHGRGHAGAGLHRTAAWLAGRRFTRLPDARPCCCSWRPWP